MHKVLVNRLGGLSLPRKSVVRLTDRLDMTTAVYHGGKTTEQLKLKCQKMKMVEFADSVDLDEVPYPDLHYLPYIL